MARKTRLTSLSVEELVKLSEEVASALSAKATQLQRNLVRLAGRGAKKKRPKRTRRSRRKK
jgi:hypothetical protein